MMGWGIAVVLLVERGMPWWGALGVALLGCFIEFAGRAFMDGLSQSRQAKKRQDESYQEARGRFETQRDKVQARLP
jgi:hypothetical protein